MWKPLRKNHSPLLHQCIRINCCRPKQAQPFSHPKYWRISHKDHTATCQALHHCALTLKVRSFHATSTTYNQKLDDDDFSHDRRKRRDRLSLEEKLEMDFRSNTSKHQKYQSASDDASAASQQKSGSDATPSGDSMFGGLPFLWKLHKEVPPPIIMFMMLITLPPSVSLIVLPFYDIASIATYTGFFMNYSAIMLAATSSIDVGLIVAPHLEPYKEIRDPKKRQQLLGTGSVHQMLQLEGEKRLLLEGSVDTKKSTLSSERLKAIKNKLHSKKFQPDILSLEATRSFDWHRALMATAVVISSAFSLQMDVLSASFLLLSGSLANIVFAFGTTRITDLPRWYAPLKLIQGVFFFSFLLGVIVLHILSVSVKSLDDSSEKNAQSLKELKDKELFPRLQRPEIETTMSSSHPDESEQKIRNLKEKIELEEAKKR